VSPVAKLGYLESKKESKNEKDTIRIDPLFHLCLSGLSTLRVRLLVGVAIFSHGTLPSSFAFFLSPFRLIAFTAAATINRASLVREKSVRNASGSFSVSLYFGAFAHTHTTMTAKREKETTVKLYTRSRQHQRTNTTL